MIKIHHANILISRGDCSEFLRELLERELDFKTTRNPDFLIIEGESFGIDDARYLERWAMGKPFQGGIKVAFVVLKSLTFEAQNALLKTLEEPVGGAHFFIHLPSLGNILPTFLSRVSVTHIDGKTSEDFKVQTDFIRGDIKKRLSLVKLVSEKKDKGDVKKFIDELEYVARGEKLDSLGVKNILTAKVFATTRGSSPKILLEWLACVL